MLKKVVGAVVALVFLVGVYVFFHLLTSNQLNLGYNKYYQPEQPIPFSHKRHAGEFGMDCRFCHAGAEVSRHAGIPSVDTCMKCHNGNVNGKSEYSKKWIKKLREHYTKKEPIPWVKVHMLPDHVKFDHSAHVNAGKSCQTCHGNIENMEKVYQHSDLSMGWCVNCHRERKYEIEAQCDEPITDLYQGDAYIRDFVCDRKDTDGDFILNNCSTCHR